MSSSSLTSVSTTSSFSHVREEPQDVKPSQYFAKHIVSWLGGEKQFNDYPFKKLKPGRVLLDWCPVHQRNFIFAKSKISQTKLPHSLHFKKMEGPIVTGLIGENPFIAFQVGVFPLISCTASSCEEENNHTISSLVASDDSESLYKRLQIKIKNNPEACVTGFIFNPIGFAAFRPKEEDLDCFRIALVNCGRRSWGDGYKDGCNVLPDEVRQKINCKYDMNLQRYTYFGEIDHLFYFPPFDSLEKFFTQFVCGKQAFVFTKWVTEYQTVVKSAPTIDKNNPVGAYTAEDTSVEERNVDTLPWMKNKDRNVLLTLWQKCVPKVTRIHPSWVKWPNSDKTLQGKSDESMQGFSVPLIVVKDQRTKKEAKPENKEEALSKTIPSTTTLSQEDEEDMELLKCYDLVEYEEETESILPKIAASFSTFILQEQQNLDILRHSLRQHLHSNVSAV